MTAHRCDFCGSRFFTSVLAWGDATCGDCMSRQIERAMLGDALLADALDGRRKPMKRAPPAAPIFHDVPVEERKTA